MSIFNKAINKMSGSKIIDTDKNTKLPVFKETLDKDFDRVVQIAKDAEKSGALKSVPRAVQTLKRLKLK